MILISSSFGPKKALKSVTQILGIYYYLHKDLDLAML